MKKLSAAGGVTSLGDKGHFTDHQAVDSIVRSCPDCRGSMYSRTQNDNGTYNTRCLFCFMTVASYVEKPEELDWLESRHMCPERVLADLVAQEKAIAFRAVRN